MLARAEGGRPIGAISRPRRARRHDGQNAGGQARSVGHGAHGPTISNAGPLGSRTGWLRRRLGRLAVQVWRGRAWRGWSISPGRGRRLRFGGHAAALADLCGCATRVFCSGIPARATRDPLAWRPIAGNGNQNHSIIAHFPQAFPGPHRTTFRSGSEGGARDWDTRAGPLKRRSRADGAQAAAFEQYGSRACPSGVREQCRDCTVVVLCTLAHRHAMASRAICIVQGNDRVLSNSSPQRSCMDTRPDFAQSRSNVRIAPDRRVGAQSG